MEEEILEPTSLSEPREAPLEQAEELSLDQLKTRDFVRLGKGRTVKLVVEKIVKAPTADDFSYALSRDVGAKKAGYRHEIYIQNSEKLLTCSVWTLFSALRKAVTAAKNIKGAYLKIAHPATGEYEVTLLGLVDENNKLIKQAIEQDGKRVLVDLEEDKQIEVIPVEEF